MTQSASPATPELEFTPTSSRFGRMFPSDLEAADWSDPDLVRLALTMVEGAQENADNCRIPAAYTYFGQFVDHDLTLDLVSSFERVIDLPSKRNFRTAALELDSVYGLGPAGSPHFYEGRDRGLLRLGMVKEPLESLGDLPDLMFDLPRFDDHVAVVADPRNDENVFVNQIHVALCRLHNRFYRSLRPGRDEAAAFVEAQTRTRLHYQHVVLNDYLPRIVGRSVIRDTAENGCRIYDPDGTAREAFIPVEFSAAAFRLGHAMVREQYLINHYSDTDASLQPGVGVRPQPIDILADHMRGALPYQDKLQLSRKSLIGGPIRQRDVVDWSLMLGGSGQRSRCIRPLLALPLNRLPVRALNGDDGARSLALRNLMRGRSLRLADGRAAAAHVASCLNRDVREFLLEEASIWPQSLSVRFKGSTVPLWYYVLREAEVRHRGTRLGPLGARIVAETFVGILKKDERSILADNRDFKPDPELLHRGRFDLRALLKAADFKVEP